MRKAINAQEIYDAIRWACHNTIFLVFSWQFFSPLHFNELLGKDTFVIIIPDTLRIPSLMWVSDKKKSVNFLPRAEKMELLFRRNKKCPRLNWPLRMEILAKPTVRHIHLDCSYPPDLISRNFFSQSYFAVTTETKSGDNIVCCPFEVLVSDTFNFRRSNLL